MLDFLSVITSDVAIVVYLSVAIVAVLFFIIKYTRKLKVYKKQSELGVVKTREDNLYQSLINKKRGNS